MIDPDAPIIPGRGAAGVTLGSRIEEAIGGSEGRWTLDPTPHPLRYRSDVVDLWVEAGGVQQIMVHGAYRGLLMGKIGLGSTIAEVQEYIGPCEEDEEDNLVIQGVPGFCFDADGDFPPAPEGVDFQHREVRRARITAMYVFPADPDTRCAASGNEAC